MKYISKHNTDKGRIVRTRDNTPTTSRSDVQIGVAWNKLEGDSPLDIDLHLALCDRQGNAIGMIYHQNQVSDCGSVYLTGDNPDGEGPGWDEAIGVDWSGLRPEVASVEAFLVIDQAAERAQHLGMVTSGYMSAINSHGEEIIHRPLNTHEGATGLIIARARRIDDWDLRFPLERASFTGIIGSLGIAA